ncbi:hypothetical protein WA158_002784 [Blastocystis sp. Blastoise]
MARMMSTSDSSWVPLVSNAYTPDGDSSSSSSSQSTQKESQTVYLKDSHVSPNNSVNRLLELKGLLESGQISMEEYRKKLTEISYPSISSSPMTQRESNPGDDTRSLSKVYVIPQDPPTSFNLIPLENAIKYIYTIDDKGVGNWSHDRCCVRMCNMPFSRGCYRAAYHLMEYDIYDSNTKEYTLEEPFDKEGKRITFVGKVPDTHKINEESFIKDVEMQILCEKYAALYNSHNPPLCIHFNNTWLIRLIDRPQQPLISVEPYLNGTYIKQNNNDGYVNNSRNTPQAFSHFTYEASGHTLIIVDIQGVGDIYTDPQIHSSDPSQFGMGNLGLEGFEKFFRTHRCNRLCEWLYLKPVNYCDDQGDGTLPETEHIQDNKISPFIFRPQRILDIFDPNAVRPTPTSPYKFTSKFFRLFGCKCCYE